jgi:hypothetical protein
MTEDVSSQETESESTMYLVEDTDPCICPALAAEILMEVFELESHPDGSSLDEIGGLFE